MDVSTALTTAVTMWHHGDIGSGWWILMMFGMVLWWGLLIAGIVWLVRAASSGRFGERRSTRTPRDILDERLASGEIDVEEYEQRAAVLEQRGPERELANVS